MTYKYITPLSVALFFGCPPAADSAAGTCDGFVGVPSMAYDVDLVELPGRTWSTDRGPLYSLGGPGEELHRVSTALFQSDGRVVVANEGGHELLLFDKAGQLISRTGREGGGPGEFRQLMSLSVGTADSLFTYDGRQRRLSVFDGEGVFARDVTLRGLDTLGVTQHVGVLQTGEIVVAFHRRSEGIGLSRDSILVTLFDPSGKPAVSLGMFPHMYTHWGPHSIPGGPGQAAFPLPVAFSSVTAVSQGDSSIYVGLPDQQALIHLDLSGNRHVTCWQGSQQAVTEVHRERLFAWLATALRMPQEELDIVRNVEGLATLPAFGFEPLTAKVGQQALLVTDVDGVWLQPFQLPDDSTA